MRVAYFPTTRQPGSAVYANLESGFRLGDHRVRPLEGKVDGPEGDRHIQPKAMEVLLVLAARPGQVISRQELLDKVWQGMVVGDEVLTRCIHELRHAFADDALDSKIIATIPKRGYQLLLSPEPLAPVWPQAGLKISEWTGVAGYLRVAVIAVMVVASVGAGGRFLNAPEPGSEPGSEPSNTVED